MEPSRQLRCIAERLRRLSSDYPHAGQMSQEGSVALHELQVDGGRLLWEAFCQGAFADGTRFERFGRDLRNSGGPDSVTWSEEGPSGKNGVWFGHTGAFGFPDGADPRREWLRLVWHRAHRLVAPEVMDYEDDEWAHGICRRIAKWIDAEAVTLEAETTRREPAGGATGTEGKAEARDGPEPPDSFNHGGKEYSGLARKPFLAVCFLWGRRNKKARRDELAQPVWEDQALAPDVTGVQGLRKEINKFFRANEIPWHAEFRNDYLCLRQGALRQSSPKPRANRGGKQRPTPKRRSH